MSDSYCTSVDIRLLQIKSKNLLNSEKLRRKCFVHLNDVSTVSVIRQLQRREAST